MNGGRPTRFRRIDRRLACENSRFGVYFDTIVTDNNQVIEDFLIVAPKTLHEGLVGGVCVLPEVDGRIGLMHGYRHQLDQAVWQAPAGFVEPGETVVATAIRELREETGLDCRPERLQSLGLTIPDAGLIEARVALFVARDAHFVSLAREIVPEPGTGNLAFFGPDELAELIQNTPDMGSSTMLACYRYLAALSATR